MGDVSNKEYPFFEFPLDDIEQLVPFGGSLVVIGLRVEEGTGRRLLILRWIAHDEWTDDEEGEGKP